MGWAKVARLLSPSWQNVARNSVLCPAADTVQKRLTRLIGTASLRRGSGVNLNKNAHTFAHMRN